MYILLPASSLTRNGKKAVVIVSAEDWMRRERRHGDLVDFFANSSLREEAIEIERQRDYPRVGSA